MEVLRPIECLDHSQSFDVIADNIKDLRVQDLLRQAGFWDFIQLKYIRFDRFLITALCDRWRPETSTFHFTAGEMTITLQDVAVLLGLPVDGAVVRYSGDVDVQGICEELLGEAPPEEAVVNNRELKVTWIKELLTSITLTDQSSVVEIEQYTRAVILLLIASRLFPNHSKGRVTVKWLYLLEDFTTIADYSWGSAVLCALFHELDVVALKKSKSIAGCLTLLLVWSWTHIPIGRPTVRDFINPGLPYGARWVGDRHWVDNPGRHATLYRNEMDVMERDSVIWNPYTEAILASLPQICVSGRESWLARTPIICLQSVSMHYPDRVMRQFGLHQHIPDGAEVVFPTGWTRETYESYVFRWDHRLDYIQHERIPRIRVEDYYSWYWHITRRFVLRQSSTVFTRYAPRGPVERDLVQGLYMISDEVDQLLQNPSDENQVKTKCFSIKDIINTILGRHRLARPPPHVPPPPPVEPAAHTYQRRRRRTTQDVVEAGSSQPAPTQTQTQRGGRARRGGRGERTPQELRNLR